MMAWSLTNYSRVACGSLLLLGLTSCGYDQYLPQSGKPVPIAKTAPRLINASAQQAQDPSPYYRNLSYRMVTVRAGDTLSKIAIRHEVPTKSVIALNNSEPPYLIHSGQRVKIPYFKHHQVRAGETLYAISRVYEVEMGEMVHFNFLEAPYTLSPGSVLKVPQKGHAEIQVASKNVKIYTVTRPTPVQPTERIVLQPPPVIRTNKDLVAGTLKAPVKAEKKPIAIAKQPREKVITQPVIVSAPPEKEVVLGGTEIASADLPPLPRNRYSIKQPPLRDGKAFHWPVRGKVLSAYGKKKNGFHNDGINIKVIPGAPVKAAENGIVSYVGNEMRSFGNLILISHADGYVTTYGHNAQILVRKGDVVHKGDIIARAGATGDVQIAQLHFEIRKEGAAVDPSRLLARK